MLLIKDELFRTTLKRLKRIINLITGKDPLIYIDYKLEVERFGSLNGGWDIYVKEINKHSIIYSFGIGMDASFDLALIKRFGLAVHAFDPTPQSIAWVQKQSFPSNFILHKYGISNFDGKVSFYPPNNPNFISHSILYNKKSASGAISVNVKRLISIMEELDHKKIDILKMDIEGAEYEVIFDIKKSNIRPIQIVVEFHHRFPNLSTKMTKNAIIILKKMGYYLYNISTSGEEYSFIYKNF